MKQVKIFSGCCFGCFQMKALVMCGAVLIFGKFGLHLKKTSGVNFTNVLQAAFTGADPKSAKKTVKLSSFLGFQDLCEHKSCSLNVDEIDPCKLGYPGVRVICHLKVYLICLRYVRNV